MLLGAVVFMKRYQLLTIITALVLVLFPWKQLKADPAAHSVKKIASKTMSMTDRHPAAAANEVYKDNILLALSYMRGETKQSGAIDWAAVRRPQTFTWTLPAGQTLAFHDGVLPEFKDTLAGTSNAHFGGNEGFKSDGYLMGNGVCHLASLMDWAAKEANLRVTAPTNHDFAAIPGVPREYGVAIYSMPESPESGANQNLYVTNTLGHDVTFEFNYDGTNLTVNVSVHE